MTDQKLKPSEVKESKPKSVEPAPKPKVTVQAPKEMKIRNPYLTLRVNIPDLPLYERNGVNTKVMKTGRQWIRERGLSVTMDGVITEDTENGGNTFESEGKMVTGDLKHITFTKKCIDESGRKVTPVKTRKAVKEAREAKKVETTESPTVQVKTAKPTADAKAKTPADAKAKTPADAKAKTPADAKKSAADTKESVPADW